jgi:hypothetical protein
MDYDDNQYRGERAVCLETVNGVLTVLLSAIFTVCVHKQGLLSNPIRLAEADHRPYFFYSFLTRSTAFSTESFKTTVKDCETAQ